MFRKKRTVARVARSAYKKLTANSAVGKYMAKRKKAKRVKSLKKVGSRVGRGARRLAGMAAAGGATGYGATYGVRAALPRKRRRK